MKKMKKIYTLLLFLFFHSYFCIAQSPDGNDGGGRVEAVKMAYMTEQLNLTPQEAQSFWPVYNSYTNEIRQARQQYANDEVAYEKKVVQIKERYQGNFRKVLGSNTQRVNKVYTSERQFKDLLRNEQKNRQQNYQQKEKQVQQPPPHNNGNKNNANKFNNKGGSKKQHPPDKKFK